MMTVNCNDLLSTFLFGTSLTVNCSKQKENDSRKLKQDAIAHLKRKQKRIKYLDCDCN